jgi:hypothetical protein
MRASALLLIAAVPAAAQGAWTPPRTPWGDPDLQGNYSNKYEQGTPFERPAEFEGRRLEDIKGEELQALIRERAVELLLNAPFTGGDPVAGNFGGAPAFYDRFEAAKGSRPWFVTDPADGRIPAMSADGQKASAARAAARAAAREGRGPADSYTDRSLYDRCITRGLPGSMMPSNYGNSYRIVQAPAYVAITYEMVHETRIVPLDGRPQLASAIRQYMGEPRGRWEGETLVVETTNFKEDSGYRGSNPETLRLVERFRPTGPDMVEWSVTIDDPTTWTRPWTFAMPLTRNDEEAVFEYACHEGNRAMANLLSGARAEEAAAAGDRSSSGSDRVSAGPPVPAAREAAAPASRTGLSGRWSAVGQGGRGGRGNFAGFSRPTRIVIAESAGEVSVSTDTGTQNQMQTAVYKLDGAEHQIPGPIGWDTRATAAREGSRLVVTIKRTVEGPDGPLNFEIKETYSVDADVLALERSQGTRTQRTTYSRD